MRKTSQPCICPVCQTVTLKRPSEIKRSKSGLLFCSRECKDKAQRIESEFAAIRPGHYGDGKYEYRKRAFREYGAKCTKCSYKLNETMLDVHHKDGNRQNNKVENLEVLCVWCHAIATRKAAIHAWNGNLGS